MYPKIHQLIYLVIVLFCKIGHGYPYEETGYVNINGMPVEVDQLFTISQVGEPGGWYHLSGDGEDSRTIYGNWDGFERTPALFYFHKIDNELYLCCDGMFVHTNVPDPYYSDVEYWGLKDVPPSANMKVVVEEDEQFPFIVRFRKPQDGSYLIMTWLKVNYGAMWPESKKRASTFYLNTSGYFYGSNVSNEVRFDGRRTTESMTLVIDPSDVPVVEKDTTATMDGSQTEKEQRTSSSTGSSTEQWTLSNLKELLPNPFKYSPVDERLDEQLYRAFAA